MSRAMLVSDKGLDIEMQLFKRMQDADLPILIDKERLKDVGCATGLRLHARSFDRISAAKLPRLRVQGRYYYQQRDIAHYLAGLYERQ